MYKLKFFKTSALDDFFVHFVMMSGGDDRRVLLWHMEKAIHSRSKPVKLKGEHLSNIFCLAFDSTNTKVFSGGKTQISDLCFLTALFFSPTVNVFLEFNPV